jgi:glycosyl transferase family 25
MKAYLINLDRSPDRLYQFAGQAAKFGLDFNRIAAVDGQSDEIKFRAERAKPGFSTGHIRPNALACFESHRTVWGLIASGCDQYALVFEDDVVFGEKFENFLNSSWIPKSADIVKLETFFLEGYFDNRPATTIDGRDVLRVRSSSFGTSAYILSREAASLLLKSTEEITDPVDEVMFSTKSHIFWKLRIFQVDPAPVVQANLIHEDGAAWSHSSINHENDKIGDRKAIKGYGLFSFVSWNRLLFKFRSHGYQQRVVNFL